jgi:lysine biosynthesis protein LysW
MVSTITVSKCPLCGEKIKVGSKPWIGQEVMCPACDAILEVVELNPLSLDWPYDDEGYYEANYDDDFYDN